MQYACKIAIINALWCRRQSEVDAKARDVRLQRALEEVERFKALLQEQRVADKDQKDVNKSEYSRVFAGDRDHAVVECGWVSSMPMAPFRFVLYPSMLPTDSLNMQDYSV